MTYCNARLPQALFVSGSRMHRPDMVDAGARALRWLVSVQTSPDGAFSAIGSDGFYSRGGTPAASASSAVLPSREPRVWSRASDAAYAVPNSSSIKDQNWLSRTARVCHKEQRQFGQSA